MKKVCGVTYNTRMTVNFAKHLIDALNSFPSELSIQEIHRLVVGNECRDARDTCAGSFFHDLQTLIAHLSSESIEEIHFKILVK